METILDSQTSTGVTSSTDQTMKVKAASAPAIPKLSADELVQKQLSAPSYLASLRENEAPPFKKPVNEPWPHLLIGTIMNEVEVVSMIAAAGADKQNGLRKFLGDFLVEKEIIANYSVSEKNFLISLLMETIDYAAQRDFDAFKLSVLLTIYIDTHIYFKWYYWQSPRAVWNYFKEVMIRHTIEVLEGDRERVQRAHKDLRVLYLIEFQDSPEGEEVFGPEDCYDIVSHFHTVYISNLPLIHIVTFGSHRLKLLWPFKTK